LEDNDAVIKMTVKGRSPALRHVPRTHRIDLDWLFERIREDPCIDIRYVNTKLQIADFLTKGQFTSAQWQSLCYLANSLPDQLKKDTAGRKSERTASLVHEKTTAGRESQRTVSLVQERSKSPAKRKSKKNKKNQSVNPEHLEETSKLQKINNKDIAKRKLSSSKNVALVSEVVGTTNPNDEKETSNSEKNKSVPSGTKFPWNSSNYLK
jgi:hypothetical protein